MAAVLGATSKKMPIVSVLSARQAPPRAITWNLYRVPLPRPATRPSQIPELARGDSGLLRGSQPLKSPITDTLSALGAQTPNQAPPSTTRAPSFSQSRNWLPSLKR